MMKAYLVRDNWCEDESEYIVFAETASKAKSIVYELSEYGTVYTRLRAYREPRLDKYYSGKTVLDWYDDDDRLIMVREADFSCTDNNYAECDTCIAKEYCRKYDKSN